MRPCRRIDVPPDGCWQSSLRIWWRLHWEDGTPMRCQREPSRPRLKWEDLAMYEDPPERGVAEAASG